MHRSHGALFVLVLVLACAGAVSAKSAAEISKAAYEYVVRQYEQGLGNFTGLVQHTSSKYYLTLNDPKFKCTLFVPDDAAFGRLYAAAGKKSGLCFSQMVNNKDLADKVFANHVLLTPLTSKAIKSFQKPKSWLGGADGTLTIRKNRKGVVTVAATWPKSRVATVIKANIKIGACVVHHVSEVLVPNNFAKLLKPWC